MEHVNSAESLVFSKIIVAEVWVVHSKFIERIYLCFNSIVIF